MGGILLIDAEQPFADKVSSSLRAAGFDVTLNDGKDAVEAARSVLPALIVLCVELPTTTGYSICNKLKKDGDLKGIPLIITSKEATPETFAQHKKLKTRAEEYIIKPFADADLLSKIAALIPPPQAGDLSLGVTGAFSTLSSELDLSSPALAGSSGSDGGAKGRDSDYAVSGEDDALLASLERMGADESASVDTGRAGKGSAARSDAARDDDLAELVDSLESPSPPAPPPSARAEPRSPPAKSASSGASAGAPPAPSVDTQQLDRMRRENSDLKARLAEAEARLTAAEEQARARESQVPAAASGGGASAAREVLNLKDQLRAKEKELIASKDELFEKEKANVDLQEQIEAVRAELEQKSDQLSSKGTELAATQAKLKAMTSERDDLTDQLRALEEQASTLKARLQSEESARTKAREALELALAELQG